MNNPSPTPRKDLFFRQIHILAVPFLLSIILLAEQEIFNHIIGLQYHPYPFEFIGSAMALGMLFFGPVIFLKGRMRYWYLFLVQLPIALIFISQYIYFSYSKGFLQASALAYANQLGDQKGTILTLLSYQLVYFLLPLFLIPLIALISRKGLLKEIILTRKEKFFGLCVLIVIITSGYGVFYSEGAFTLKTIAHPSFTLRNMNGFVFAPNDMVKKVGIVNYYFRDIIGYTLRHEPLTPENVQFTKQWIDKKAPTESKHLFGSAKGRNLIILQVESLEQAVIGQSIGGMEITPNLNSLLKRSYSFPNYFAQVGPGNTADAEFVTLNSLYPLSNIVAFIEYPNNTYTALPKLLRQNGYSTYALHVDVPTFWNRSNIYPSLGYQTIISKEDFVDKGELVFNRLNDEEFLTQSLEKMKSFKAPFMATLITLSSHTPYVIPKDLQELPIPEDSDLNDRQRNYLQSVNYTDRAIGEFIAGLEASGLAEQSIVALYGDHGSFTNISEKIGTSSSSRIVDVRTHQVPLILFAPGSLGKKVIPIPSSHLDLYPTLVNLLGIEKPNTTIGQDLLNTKHPVVTHRDPDSQIINTIVSEKLIYSVAEDGVFEHGTCLIPVSNTILPIGVCLELYQSQLEATRASDFIVKGNLMPKLTSSDSFTKGLSRPSK